VRLDRSPTGHGPVFACSRQHAGISLAFPHGVGDDRQLSMMRKSGAVPLTLLATAALAAVSGCNDHPKELRNCVDAENHIVRDSLCNPSPSPGRSGGGGYHFVYGGASGGGIDDTVVGGSNEPEAGAEVVSGESGAVVRGGFGSSESGAHGGEGGGEGGGE
jgi:hypothetical protein